jgi:hypothetical protein
VIPQESVLAREDDLRRDAAVGMVECPALADGDAEPPGQRLDRLPVRRVVGDEQQRAASPDPLGERVAPFLRGGVTGRT